MLVRRAYNHTANTDTPPSPRPLKEAPIVEEGNGNGEALADGAVGAARAETGSGRNGQT